MHFSNRFLRVLSILSWNTFIKCESNEDMKDNNSPDADSSSVFSDFVERFVNKDPVQNIKNNANNKTLIEIVIDNKIEELKPYLQDDDTITMDTENNLTLEGKDETTIIEFVPKLKDVQKDGLRDKREPLKNNVNKYKKVREKIKRALNKETISDKTQLLVMKTLDDLIAKLIGSQCSWKSGMENNTIGSNLRTSQVINEMWNQQWNKLKDSYMKKFKHDSDPQQFEEVLSFLDKLQNFFSLITKDVDTLAEQYKIKCIFLDKPVSRKHQNLVYDSESDLNRRNCQQFIICSKELKHYMIDFYNSLNDTAISVVRNYAEMYLRDTDNDLEKQNIVASINNTGNIVEKNLVDIFIRQTKAFQLDENKNKEANIKSLSEYIKSLITEVKNNVKATIGEELKSFDEKKAYAIQADINVNLKVDIENLEREMLGRICLVFKFCNGKYKGRRSGYLIDINKENDIYVKVQLTLDDNNKKSKFKNLRRYMKTKDNYNVQQTTSQLYKNISYIVNVTRTTPYIDSIIIKDD